MKHFKQDDFNWYLAMPPWEKLAMTENVDVMAPMFVEMTKKAFVLCEPEQKIPFKNNRDFHLKTFVMLCLFHSHLADESSKKNCFLAETWR